jgi:hypothetical protein
MPTKRPTKKVPKKNPKSFRRPQRPTGRAQMPPSALGGTLSGFSQRSQITSTYHLIESTCYIDWETDIANIKANVLIPALNMAISTAQIDKWNSTQQDNFADLICYGTQLLIELKMQTIQREYCPALTKADGTNGASLTTATLDSFLRAIYGSGVRIPAVCYPLADLYTMVIQIRGQMWHPARSGEYIVFAQPYKDYAELETLLANIMGLYDAVVYATQGNLPLLPVSQMWMESIKEVPYLSDYACMIANYFPTLYDNGGAETETFYEIDETTDIMWMDYFGIPEWYDALALFRSTSCADNPLSLLFSLSELNKNGG